MSEHCKGEVHYIDSEGVERVHHAFNFPFPIRMPVEPVPEFKQRVTDVVLKASKVSRGHEITAVKWTGPLGYHQGYVVDPKTPHIKRINLNNS